MRSLVSSFVALPLLAFLSLSACASLEGLTGGDGRSGGNVDPNNDDDGACENADLSSSHDHCGACEAKCGAGEHCLEGKCAPGCPDHAVFVSADGNDNADGCSAKTPKRTIGAALALLKSLGAEKHEVRVCRGQYNETVTLDWAANIAGGFECSTWKRSEAYGAPDFDPTNAAVVNAPSGGAALVVDTVVDVVVDGLTLNASPAGADRSVAVLTKNAARVTLANDVIRGGGGSTAISPASVGVLVDDGAMVTVKASLVEGGAGTKTTSSGYGSAGVYAPTKAGGLVVDGSTIRGGAGAVSGGTGSAGVLAFGGRIEVRLSNLHGGTGKTGGGSSSFGLLASPNNKSDVDVIDNVIDGGNGTCTADCSTTGARVATGGVIRFTNNRVTGGEADAPGNDVRFTGVSLADFANADVQNNEVFSGNTRRKLTHGVVALEAQRGTTLLLAHNTLGVGPAPLSAGGALVVDAKSSTIANNLFFFAGTAVDHAARVSSCNARKVTAFRNNAWVGFPENKPLLAIDALAANGITCATGVASASAAANIEASIDATFGAGVALGNVRVASACSGDPNCRPAPACSSGAACATALFGAWDDATAGNLLAGGWKLTSGAPCAVVKATGATSALTDHDAFGQPRTEPRSVGAHESDAACQ